MARYKRPYIPKPGTHACEPVPPVPDPERPPEPPLPYDRVAVHADLVRMRKLPRPPRKHKRAQFQFADSLKNYGCALYPILRETHPGLKEMAKYRALCYCWRMLSDGERWAWTGARA